MEFKDKLKQLRKDKNISQQQLADAIYVSRSAIAKWENGLGYPSVDSMEALAAYFGVEERDFRTEEPEVVIVQKNNRIQHLTNGIIAVLLAMLVAAGSILAGFWFGSASSADMEELGKQASEYLKIDGLEVMLTDQRGDYLAALCRSPENKWALCVYERDPVFQDRWVASGGKKRLTPGELESWNYGDPRGDAVLIFCGHDLSEDILFYTFSNSGADYTFPVNGDMVLNIVIIPDNGHNINGTPIPLDENHQPIG